MYYYHFDGLGSVVALSDVNSVIVERYSYDVFGAPTIYDADGSEIPQSAVGNPYMFTARRADDETALYYYRARYYAFDIGRFLQTDPLGYSEGLNLYTYCRNNPALFVDPRGEGLWKLLYTGDWSAPDYVYNEATEAAATWLYENSLWRGAYTSVGTGGKSVSMSWTMDSGISFAGRVSLTEPLGSGQFGTAIGLRYKPGEGLGPTGQHQFKLPGVEFKFDLRGNLKIGLTYKVWSGGIIVNPSLFTNTISAWGEILGGKCKGSAPKSTSYNWYGMPPADPVDVSI